MIDKKKNTKIANIVCAFPPYAGGIGNSAAQISRLLSEKFEVVDFHPDNIKPLIKRGHGAFSPKLLFKLSQFDYIYLHYPFFGTAEIVWLFKLFNKKTKLIIHYHMDVKSLSVTNKILSLPSKLIVTSLLKKADMIVSASFDYIENSSIQNYYKKNKEKFIEIPFGIDLDKFQVKEINQTSGDGIIAKAKEIINKINEKYIKKDKTDFIFIGGLDDAHYFKGLNNLISALSKTPGNWKLKVVGDGNKKKEYELEAYKVGLDKKIEFCGKLSNTELIRALQDSDCLILPSINNNEAFGIVIIEALACGLSIIASDLPGVRKVFEDNKQGYLVKANDIDDLKLALIKTIKSKERRKEMSKEARKLAELKYNETEMKRKLIGLINLLNQ